MLDLETTDRAPIWEPCLTIRREYDTAGGWQPLDIDTHISRFNPTVCRAGRYAMRPEEFERRAALPVPEVRTRVHLGTLTDADCYPVPRPVPAVPFDYADFPLAA